MIIHNMKKKWEEVKGNCAKRQFKIALIVKRNPIMKI